MAQMRQGLAAYRAMGAVLTQTYWLALLAETYGRAGQVEAGLTAIAEALAAVDTSGERFYEAELYRLKGELTLQSQAQGRESRSAIVDQQAAKALLEELAERHTCTAKSSSRKD
jgi:predicted ATPase